MMSERMEDENLTTSSTGPVFTGMVVSVAVAISRGDTGLERERERERQSQLVRDPSYSLNGY